VKRIQLSSLLLFYFYLLPSSVDGFGHFIGPLRCSRIGDHERLLIEES
jgi:hypothetical protein